MILRCIFLQYIEAVAIGLNDTCIEIDSYCIDLDNLHQNELVEGNKNHSK